MDNIQCMEKLNNFVYRLISCYISFFAKFANTTFIWNSKLYIKNELKMGENNHLLAWIKPILFSNFISYCNLRQNKPVYNKSITDQWPAWKHVQYNPYLKLFTIKTESNHLQWFFIWFFPHEYHRQQTLLLWKRKWQIQEGVKGYRDLKS